MALPSRLDLHGSLSTRGCGVDVISSKVGWLEGWLNWAAPCPMLESPRKILQDPASNRAHENPPDAVFQSIVDSFRALVACQMRLRAMERQVQGVPLGSFGLRDREGVTP